VTTKSGKADESYGRFKMVIWEGTILLQRMYKSQFFRS